MITEKIRNNALKEKHEETEQVWCKPSDIKAIYKESSLSSTSITGTIYEGEVLEHTLMPYQGCHLMKIALEDKIEGGNDDSTNSATYRPYLNHKSRTAGCDRERSDIRAEESTYGPYLGPYIRTGHCQIQAWLSINLQRNMQNHKFPHMAACPPQSQLAVQFGYIRSFQGMPLLGIL